VSEVGARSVPPVEKQCLPPSAEARGDDTPRATAEVQRAIDACSASGGGTLTLDPGSYKTGALFLKNDVRFVIPKGVTLHASGSGKDYPKIWTRVAGIEMEWPAGLINVNERKNVMISGGGTIEGRGHKDWTRYILKLILDTPIGLRWAADYDVTRVRNIVIWKSSDVTVKDLALKKSGFWNVQVVYSDHVSVDGVTVSEASGPSTDGVDVDSSHHVLVQNCDISCADDAIAMKAGRDFDGLRVNQPTEYVVLRGNTIRSAHGMLVFGSETSGSIRHVYAEHNQAFGSERGIRFKSAHTRGGVVEDILIRDTRMTKVPAPFVLEANWKPSYSYARIPGWAKNPPAHWKVLATPVVPAERGWPEFRDISIEDVEITGAKEIFSASGLSERPIRGVHLSNVRAEGETAGKVEFARDWTMKDVKLRLRSGQQLQLSQTESVELPEIDAK
jgi:polygalacturonase